MPQQLRPAVVRDDGTLVGVRPNAQPHDERGITISVVVTDFDGPGWRSSRARRGGELLDRVHLVVPLDRGADHDLTVIAAGVALVIVGRWSPR